MKDRNYPRQQTPMPADRIAGRSLMEDMTRARAIALFADEGYPVKSLSDDGLHEAWINLQRKYHEGGRSPDPQKAQMINVAYDILKREPLSGNDDVHEDVDADLPLVEYTVWGWDGEYLLPGFRIECTTRQFDKVITMARVRLRHGFIWPLGVLLQPRASSYDARLLLIYINGHPVNPPQSFETEGDPRVDQRLKMLLSKYNT
jgi:hypothetical protein